MALGQHGLAGDVEGMLLHSHDFLEMASIVVVAWQHLAMAAAARSALAGPARTHPPAFYEGKLRAAQYWIANEVPRVARLADLCVQGESSYAAIADEAW
jgi:butyryl-CoA dehydrogenase